MQGARAAAMRSQLPGAAMPPLNSGGAYGRSSSPTRTGGLYLNAGAKRAGSLQGAGLALARRSSTRTNEGAAGLLRPQNPEAMACQSCKTLGPTRIQFNTSTACLSFPVCTSYHDLSAHAVLSCRCGIAGQGSDDSFHHQIVP